MRNTLSILILLCGIIWPHCKVLADTKSHLTAVANTIKVMENKKDSIAQKLYELKQSHEFNHNLIHDIRYKIAKNIFLYHKMAQINPSIMQLIDNGNIQDHYFEREYNKYLKKSLEHYLTDSIQEIINIEQQIIKINEYELQKNNLEQSIHQAFQYLEKHQPIDDIAIDKLQQQALDLNEFILNIIDTEQTELDKSLLKTSYIMPLSGVVIQDNDRLLIRSNHPSIVVAPAHGRIIHSGYYKNLSGIIIIKHADNHLSIIHGLNQTFGHAGLIVNQGDSIGVIAPENSLDITKEKSNNAMLYYELRYNGRTINPIKKISGQ